MSKPQLNKQLYTDISKLKNLNPNTKPKFILDRSPFNDDDDDQAATASAQPDEIVILGRILPDSEIFNQGAYQIEMKLKPTYPFDPPEVRFITKIYHPNVAENGEFCNEMIKKTAKWRNGSSLVDVVSAVTEHIDHPNIDHAMSLDLGRQYMENRPEFDQKALEFVKKHALSRT